MVALADVRRWDPAGVETALTRLGAARDRLLDLDPREARPPDGWRGTAATAARAEQERLVGRLRRLADGVAAVRPGVAAAADAVAGLRRDLDHADALADARGFGISPDGTVTDIRQTVVAADQVDVHLARRTAEQAEILDLLGSVLRRATDLDTALADLLTRTDLGAADGPAAVPPGPPPATAPAAARWWHGLTAAERERVIAEHPGWVGPRDGLPAAAKDAANRALLAGETARLDHAIADATTRWRAALDVPLPPGMEGQGETAAQLHLRHEIERLQGRRDALVQVGATVAPPGRQLLLLDVSGHDQPHAAIAVGDVDTADHVAVFTPGFTTTVASGIAGYTHDMAGVRETALDQLLLTGHPEQTVATVAWLGYDAPQWDTTLDPDGSVAAARPAQDGGRALAGFLDGIGASRADDPHLTALGHSYGSTTTGYALQQTGVDDAVLFGSPGAGTDTLGDLGVPDGHVGVVEARRDAVADLGRFGGDANHLDGAVHLSARAATGPDGRALSESVGHSDYLTPGSTSQHNIAATVAGLPDQRITTDDDSGLGDVLRWAF